MLETDLTLGIELGSTRIKAVLLDEQRRPFASGSYGWENLLENGIWTYALDEVWRGLQACYAELKEEAETKLGHPLYTVGAIGISGMMHGYLPFDAAGRQLAAFRTWRNTMTGEAARRLTEIFDFEIPQRWSIAHFYQALLWNEPHAINVRFFTTLSGYVHWKLTGEKVVGIGEASGMFPIDSDALDYSGAMLEKFDALSECRLLPPLRTLLPCVLPAGAVAGRLTEEGARLLDPTGVLRPGIPLCPPEGDAGTGMVATNSVAPGTGNVSAGTSDFAMVVVDHPLGMHREINMVTTPAGKPVAMVHCSNCTSDLNAWVSLFAQFADLLGVKVRVEQLFPLLFQKALAGAPDGGGLLSYNYYSGEGITGLDAGRPVFVRRPDASFTLENFMRTHLISALATLKLGLDILKKEQVTITRLCGHGGFFKTPEVGQRILSAATGAPVTVLETAGEGGAYGVALLADYMRCSGLGETLETYLDKYVFADAAAVTVEADAAEMAGFDDYIQCYRRALEIEKAAVSYF